MLSRTGNQLILAARCLERAEQMAGFAKAQQLCAMDAPIPEYKTAVWDFLLKSFQAKQAYDESCANLNELQVLHFIAIADLNPNAIRKTVAHAREHIRGTRDRISAPLWEYINSFYHSMQAYTEEQLKLKGFGSFAQKVERHCYTIKGYIDSNLSRSEEWKLLSVGFHLERAIIMNRLLLYTLEAIAATTKDKQTQPLSEYYMRSMLESMDCYEVYKHYYKTPINHNDFLHFTVHNPVLPKSIAYNLQRIKLLAHGDDGHGTSHEENILLLQAATMATDIYLQNPVETASDNMSFLSQNLTKLQHMATALEQEQLVQ